MISSFQRRVHAHTSYPVLLGFFPVSLTHPKMYSRDYWNWVINLEYYTISSGIIRSENHVWLRQLNDLLAYGASAAGLMRLWSRRTIILPFSDSHLIQQLLHFFCFAKNDDTTQWTRQIYCSMNVVDWKSNKSVHFQRCSLSLAYVTMFQSWNPRMIGVNASAAAHITRALTLCAPKTFFRIQRKW